MSLSDRSYPSIRGFTRLLSSGGQGEILSVFSDRPQSAFSWSAFSEAGGSLPLLCTPLSFQNPLSLDVLVGERG